MMKFYGSLLCLILIQVVTINAGAFWGWWEAVPTYTLEVVLFTGFSTGVLFFWLSRQATGSGFAQSYLLSIVLKMLVFSVFVMVVIYADAHGAFANAVIFLISYFVFTALEVGFLYQKINQPKLPK